MKPIFATSRQISPATTPANPALQTASVDSDTGGSPNNPNNPNNFSYEKVSDRYGGVRADISKRKVTHRLLESPVPSPLLAEVQVRPAIQMRLNLPRHKQRPGNDARACCGLIFSPATTPHNPGPQPAGVDPDTGDGPNNANNANNFSYEKVSARYDGVRTDTAKRKVTLKLLESLVPPAGVQCPFNTPAHLQSGSF